MKKIVRTLCLTALVALVAVSCKKNTENTSFNVSIAETSGFEAGPSLDGSKAYLDPADGYQFKWSNNDKLMAYNLATNSENSVVQLYTINSGQGQHNAGFSGPSLGVKQDLGFRLFYNGNMAERELEEGNRATFHVEAEQNYDPACMADPNALVMATAVQDVNGHSMASFTMQHIFGYLNVAIANNTGAGLKKVSSIVVEDAHHNLSGEVSLKLPAVDTERFTTLMGYIEAGNQTAYLAEMQQYLSELGYCANPEGKTITMNCNNFVLPYAQWQYFFISLRPGALYEGFTITINYEDGSYSKEFVANNNYVIKPGHIRNVYFTTKLGFLQ